MFLAHIYHDFLASYLGEIDGETVLGETVRSELILKTVDPPKSGVTVHGELMQQRDANGMRTQRVRVTVYGHEYQKTKDVAEVLHATVVGSAKLFDPNQWCGERTFFDHVESEQAPRLNQSQGLTSVAIVFDLSVTSRPVF